MLFVEALPLARLLHHFDKHFSGLRRIRNFSKERDAGSMHAVLGFQADAKAEAIDRGHRRFRASMPANRLASRMSASLWSAFMCCMMSFLCSATGSE